MCMGYKTNQFHRYFSVTDISYKERDRYIDHLMLTDASNVVLISHHHAELTISLGEKK